MLLSRNAYHFPFDIVADGSVATIGAYDGLHLGHQALLDKVIATAKSKSLPSVVMSFEPTPREFFQAEKPPARLMRFREKFEALAESGIDIFFCPRFDTSMKNIAADTFIRKILIHSLNIQHLVVGDDFRFATRRSGNFDLLCRAGTNLGFTVEQVSSILQNDERASSTDIREALWTGDLIRAKALLGRDYRMSGRVIIGNQLGRTLGYPTANVNLNRRQSPVMGIFAVRVSGVDWGPLDAVASVGTRPTFDGIKPLLEVHIFNFDRDIYGQYIHVDFVSRLRGEEKFDNADQLIAQMDIDSAMARDILQTT